MYNMYIRGIFKTGTQSYDLVENGHFTEEEAKEYERGNTKLTTAMNAARYAFYADYPEVFYVNFQKLSIRITKDSNNKYHANIGSGRYADYYTTGFSNKEEVDAAVVEFDNKVNEIIEGAKSVKEEVSNSQVKDEKVEQMKYVHNQIIRNASYRLETDCKEGYEGFLGTPYGILVKGQGVCEGYSRAFKTILDKMGFASILVQGTHKYEDGVQVPHMWNYVKIENQTSARSVETKWYAVDATFDDPFIRKLPPQDGEWENPGDDIVEGFENTKYFLVGEETMNRDHNLIETVEATGDYKFTYPELSLEDYGNACVFDKDKLVVKYKQDGYETEEYKAGEYYISYDNKGYEQAAKEGKYILLKTHYYKPGDEVWEESPWAYFLPDVYAGGFSDEGSYIYMYLANAEYAEVAVTTLAPGDYQNDPKYLAYQGDESDFVVKTDKMYNPSGTYKGRPYIKKQTPRPTQTFSVGPTYKVEVIYDDDLILKEGATEVGYEFTSSGPTGATHASIKNFKFDGKRTITFDLEFSKMFADDQADYFIKLTGLVGYNSGKEPMEITYSAANDILCSFRMNKAKNWEVFGRPTLIESEDLSLSDWETTDGTHLADKLSSRIALITSKITATEKESMDNLVKEELNGKEIIASETYNISLNVCKKYVVKTGHRLQISLGFPAGYGPDDAGVTFKAYHFVKDNNGNVIKTEEIPCVVTQYGLIITCDSFSPFSVVATKSDENDRKEKSIVLAGIENGKINTDSKVEGGIITLKENTSTNLNIVPEEGYEIESITACGKAIEVTDRNSIDISVNYNDISNVNSIVEAKFVAKSVLAQEAQKQQTVVQPRVVPAEITLPETKLVSIKNELVITPTITETSSNQTYQWYKDDKALEGKTDKVLRIDNVTEEDEGAYKLKVRTSVETMSEESISEKPCNVTVSSFATTMNTQSTTFEPGSTFEVNTNINNYKNISKGLMAISGQIEYDSNVLEIVSMEGKSGWDFDKNSVNDKNWKFVTLNNAFIENGGDISKIIFKVKENVNKAQESIVTIKNIVASNGDVEVNSNDATLKLNITLPDKPEEGITSDVYLIKDGYISKIEANTTVSIFKNNVTTKQNMVFKDKEGNILDDSNIVKTGDTLQVGSQSYTLVVTGDIDGNGVIGTNDIAKLKLHYIERELLTGIKLKAADMNYDGEISLLDLAKIKLILIQ